MAMFGSQKMLGKENEEKNNRVKSHILCFTCYFKTFFVYFKLINVKIR